MNFTVGLTNSTGLNGNLVATSLYSFNFLVLVESPFTWFSLQSGYKQSFLKSSIKRAFSQLTCRIK